MNTTININHNIQNVQIKNFDILEDVIKSAKGTKSEEIIIGIFSIFTLSWSASSFFHIFGQWAIIPTIFIAGLISFAFCISHCSNLKQQKTNIFRLPKPQLLFQKGIIRRRKKRVINIHKTSFTRREAMTSTTV